VGLGKKELQMRTLTLAAGLVASLAVVAGTGPAGAQPTYYHHHHHYHHYYSREGCAADNRRSGRIGAVSGAVGGAIIGSAITHGNGPSALLGAGAGALAGNAIGRNSRHC
jgi:hypothetical protein